MPEPAERRLEIALRINQEICRHNYLFAFGNTTDHFHIIVAALAQTDCTRFKASLGELDKRNVARAAIDDSGNRHGQHLASVGNRDLHLSKHGGLQQPARIVDFQPHRYGTGCRIQGWVNVGNGAFE